MIAIGRSNAASSAAWELITAGAFSAANIPSHVVGASMP
jgi:hypothetical protein